MTVTGTCGRSVGYARRGWVVERRAPVESPSTVTQPPAFREVQSVPRIPVKLGFGEKSGCDQADALVDPPRDPVALVVVAQEWSPGVVQSRRSVLSRRVTVWSGAMDYSLIFIEYWRQREPIEMSQLVYDIY